MIVLAIAVAAAARSAWFWHAMRPGLDPDTQLYTQGGIGLFPSPIGRIIGAGGVELLAVVNAAAGAVLIVTVALVAHQLGGNVVLAAAIALMQPLAYWTIFAGVDTLGALLVVAAVYVDLRRSSRSTILWAASCLTHASTVPLALVRGVAGTWAASSRRLRWVPVAAIFAAIVCFLALTPYGGNLGVLRHPERAVRCAVLTVVLVAIVFLPAAARLASPGGRRIVVPLLIGTAIAAAAVGSERSSSSRYGLPAAMVMAAVASTPRRLLS